MSEASIVGCSSRTSCWLASDMKVILSRRCKSRVSRHIPTTPWAGPFPLEEELLPSPSETPSRDSMALLQLARTPPASRKLSRKCEWRCARCVAACTIRCSCETRREASAQSCSSSGSLSTSFASWHRSSTLDTAPRLAFASSSILRRLNFGTALAGSSQPPAAAGSSRSCMLWTRIRHAASPCITVFASSRERRRRARAAASDPAPAVSDTLAS
mmetsp:Transcript_54599/g.124803  ORF Transcript_54599/g.124803 Transcript_54599/m.124803 type:complete len:215 (-) Transcript_54599:651-1295(-)